MARGTRSVAKKKGYTGTFPASPKDPQSFRQSEYDKQNGFKGSSGPKQEFAPLSDYSKIDPYPKYKAGGKLSNAGGGGDTGRPEVDVNVGSDLAPTKGRPFKSYAPITKPPQGRALPVRGEHGANTGSNNTL